MIADLVSTTKPELKWHSSVCKNLKQPKRTELSPDELMADVLTGVRKKVGL